MIFTKVRSLPLGMVHLICTIFTQMFFDVSYRNKDVDDEIKELVGNSFSFWERLKWVE